MHKFLLAENPMAPESSGVFIIHLPDPTTIIQVLDDPWPRRGMGGKVTVNPNVLKHFSYINLDGITEEYTLSVYHMFSTDFLEVPEDRAYKMLDKAWHWYKSYLQWEDNNIDNDI